MGVALSPVLYQLRPGILCHWCPGCQTRHPIHVRHPDSDTKVTALWNWDGNVDQPTFSPSIRVLGEGLVTECHYFIRQGQIQFCSDSPHALAGQTVPLPTIPD